MNKQMGFKIQKCNPVPPSLCQQGIPTPLDSLSVDFDALCQHLYLDTFGSVVPHPNPAVQLYSDLLTASEDLEFVGTGPGTHKEVKTGQTNIFGKACTRWFLDTHFGIVLFAHMDDILDKPVYVGNQVAVKRLQKGDTPDYVCTDGSTKLFVVEAKGRKSSIAFGNAEFKEWRTQLTRIGLQDPAGQPVGTKSFIVAARLKNESHGGKVRSTLYCEDPETPGEATLSADDFAVLKTRIAALHYAPVFAKLSLLPQASALRNRFVVQNTETQIGVWECNVPPLNRRSFVGGLLPTEGAAFRLPWYYWPMDRKFPKERYFIDDLTIGQTTFFGLERQRFDTIASIAKGVTSLNNLGPAIEASVDVQRPIGMTFLKDGTLLCPRSYMRLTEVITI